MCGLAAVRLYKNDAYDNMVYNYCRHRRLLVL